MQHYTTIEQSNKLVELGLNPDTADMYFPDNAEITEIREKPRPVEYIEDKDYPPCWSLGALLELMPSMISHGQYDSTLVIYKYVEFRVCYENMYHLDEIWFNKENLLDAAFEMSVWLLENGYIKKGE